MTTITISLPQQIATEVDQAAKVGGFATRSEFIRNLIRGYFYPFTKFEEFNPRPLSEIKKDLAMSGKYSSKFINSVIMGLEKSSVYGNKTAKT